MERTCKQCLKKFTPRHHGGTKEFCTYTCANTYQWRYRIRKPPLKKQCVLCGAEFVKYYSMTQWASRRFCSNKCATEARKKHDGMSKSERYLRKHGALKMGTPEWLERIRSTTKDAMQKPEIKLKLQQKRMPRSLELKIRQSNLLAGKMPKNIMFGNSNFPNVQRGDYENSKGTMYFRSKWEANYALYLDFLIKQNKIKSWEYEADVFMFEKIKLGTRSYRPDFKVFNNDDSFEYHEVKGYMDSRSKTKLKRMAKYYPEVKLILIDKEYYLALIKQIGKMIHFYE